MISAHAFLITAVLLAPPMLPAQTGETPTAVATRFVDAMRVAQWDSMAALMHPEALRHLRELLTPVLESPAAADARQQLFGFRDPRQAARLSDAEVFGALMRATIASDPATLDALKSATLETLGEVPEGRDTVHVVYRLTLELSGIRMSRMDVMTLRRYHGTWRGLLKGDVSALAALLRRTFTE